MPELIYITNDWSEQPWYSTGGTRAKKYIQSPEGNFYYFKRSQYKPATDTKPGKDFKYEFWSEIIASEIGKLFGFTVLEYNIAIDGNVIGCICKSMISSNEEELIEGIKYLQAYDNSYNPEDKSHQTKYTFQMIEAALEKFNVGNYIEDIVEIILFDAIIGNGDRHQENWAIINQYTEASKALKDLEDLVQEITSDKIEILSTEIKMVVHQVKDFAPIYDNGSSLGRELTEEKIEQLLNASSELDKYINRGQAEIHWQGKKVSHFQLIQNLLASPYSEKVKTGINRIIQTFDGPKIAQIIQTIDEKVPESFASYRIPASRKQLITKIITLRIEKLCALIHDGI